MTEPWPDSLDAAVAAPEHHSVLFENERVRVLDARVERGDTVPLQTHRWPGVQYLTSCADFVRRYAGGMVLVDSRTIRDLAREAACPLVGADPSSHARERRRRRDQG